MLKYNNKLLMIDGDPTNNFIFITTVLHSNDHEVH